MARRHHRRRHRYGDPLVSMPSFGDLKNLNPLGKSVNSTDVLLGAGIGVVGGAAVKYVTNMAIAPASQPTFLQTYMGPISSIGAGIAAFLLLKKKSSQKATGVLTGAILAGVVPAVFAQLKASMPAYFSGYGDPLVRMPSYNGLLTASPTPYAGLLTASPTPGYAGYEDPVANFVEG